jgi:hypothetical protein
MTRRESFVIGGTFTTPLGKFSFFQRTTLANTKLLACIDHDGINWYVPYLHRSRFCNLTQILPKSCISCLARSTGIPDSEFPAVEHLFKALYLMYLVREGTSSLRYPFHDSGRLDDMNFFHDSVLLTILPLFCVDFPLTSYLHIALFHSHHSYSYPNICFASSHFHRILPSLTYTSIIYLLFSIR